MPSKNIRTSRRLTDDLILPDYFSKKLGYDNFLALLNDLKNAEEGYNSNGISHFCEAISSKGFDVSDYDKRIKDYVRRISSGREHGFRLRYYQYLAVLFTEMYLEEFFADKTKGRYVFINEINRFVDKTNRGGSSKLSSTDFKPPKLAYYMATGSGKTIVMHINYLQFLHYAKERNMRIDNCILITPSENMTRQHLDELKKSGIDAMEFDGLKTLDSYSVNNDTIKVIDINKLKESESKKGTGVTVDIAGFGSHNLIMVDEGHKGYKSEERTWARIRDAISLDGFAFEYSATFEQAVSSDQELYGMYSHAILIDYSYRHFYRDGYGKDFFIVNLEKSFLDEIETQRTLLLANALSFLSQLLVYRNKKDIVRKYDIESPLWIFVGSKVGVSDNATTSDIIDVIKFLDWVTSPSNKREVIDRIKAIVDAKSGIQDQEGNDVFSQRYDEILFPYGIREFDDAENIDLRYERIYSDMLKNIFKSFGTRGIELYRISETDGEIGIRCDSDYFGVIDVGDRAKLLKDLEEKLPLIKIHEDKITKSLFNSITEEPEKINILIGAKKFIEGWDTKRVSSMCLLNIGKKEGAQIIQLFGRGVRLNGENKSMKREVEPSNELRAVQTLYIFGLEASYLITFRDIVKEEVLYTLRTIKIKDNTRNISPPLEIITINEENLKSYRSEVLYLTYDSKIVPAINLLATAETVSSIQSGIQSTVNYEKCIIDKLKLDLVNWNEIYFRILDYKYDSDFRNLVISNESFDSIKKELFYNKDPQNGLRYELIMDPELCKNFDLEKVGLIEDAIFEIMKKYIISYYDKKIREEMSSKNNVYDKAKFNRPIPENYKMYVDADFASKNRLPDSMDVDTLIKQFPSLSIRHIKTSYDSGETSLYVPLISYDENLKFKITPEGLNRGEEKFIEDLISFLEEKSKNDQRFNQLEFYLYRNPSRSGVCFYVLNETIYPDFVLWVRKKQDPEKQVLIFIEPHGLVYADPNSDPKINLPGYLKEMNNNIVGLSTYAFIISVTDRNSVKSKFKINYEFSEKGILFQNEPGYVNCIIETILKELYGASSQV
mgnify:FL=1